MKYSKLVIITWIFKSYSLPSAWLKFVVYCLFQDELAENDLFSEFEESGYETEEPINREELEPYFLRLKKLGFSGYDDWERDFNDEEKWIY